MSRQQPKLSILISSYERPHLFKRCLYSIATSVIEVPFEVIVCDDGSQSDIGALLRKFSVQFPWKLIHVDSSVIEDKMWQKRYYNNPAFTNNVAFKHASGDLIALMGNEVIAWKDCFNQMLSEVPTNNEPFNIFSKTYDIPQNVLDGVDVFGQHINEAHIQNHCAKFPLQDETYQSDVTNYLSLSSRFVWERLEGYDERFLFGIACEDSDWVRRCRTLPGYKHILSKGVSLHQYHGGMTKYYQPTTIDMVKWNKGLSINRKVYDAWDGKAKNSQPWKWGDCGKVEIETSGY